MAAICTKGTKHCDAPCEPEVPAGSGPWVSTTPPINNLHREYIEGVPGVFVQHPTTDPERDQILRYMTSGQDNIRGLEVFNSWAEQAWDAVVPRSDDAIDPLYPVYPSVNCTAWQPYLSDPERYPEGSCSREWGMMAWDATLRALKRPVWGLADDDGFVYTGDSEDPIYRHGRHDVKSDGPSWFRFGVGYSMVKVPPNLTSTMNAADISKAVDRGEFYASTGVDLDYDTSDPYFVTVTAYEPVVFGVTGGTGVRGGNIALSPFNLTLCQSSTDNDTVVNCESTGSHGGGDVGPPAARRLRVDLGAVGAGPDNSSHPSFFFVRVQAHVRTRYPVVAVDNSDGEWAVTVAAPPADAARDLAEGMLLRATGASRRPLVVQHTERIATNASMGHLKVELVRRFSKGGGDITPDLTTLDGLQPGVDQLVAERWAWVQPTFRTRGADGSLTDPFAR